MRTLLVLLAALALAGCSGPGYESADQTVPRTPDVPGQPDEGPPPGDGEGTPSWNVTEDPPGR